MALASHAQSPSRDGWGFRLGEGMDARTAERPSIDDIDEALANLITVSRDQRAEYADKLLDLRNEMTRGESAHVGDCEEDRVSNA